MSHSARPPEKPKRIKTSELSPAEKIALFKRVARARNRKPPKTWAKIAQDENMATRTLEDAWEKRTRRWRTRLSEREAALADQGEGLTTRRRSGRRARIAPTETELRAVEATLLADELKLLRDERVLLASERVETASERRLLAEVRRAVLDMLEDLR